MKKKILKVKKTKYHSWKSGPLTDGCRQCIKGEKLVLFVTGLCSQRCVFCPISDRKLYKDVIYANEREVKKNSDILDEAKVSRAKGAGFTGGDPLMKIDRVGRYIRLLKKEFGKKFHTHLYTPLNLINEKNLDKLCDAGLDEIRFHPDLLRKEQWERIILAKKFNWRVGVEIPALPGTEKEVKELIDFLEGKIDFLNINELELADNSVWRRVKNIETKDKISYAIKGSEVLAKKLIIYSSKKNIPTHYCTCKLKDAVQLTTRVKRRSKLAKLETDKVTVEGMLLRGAVYLPELKPDFGYRNKLNELNSRQKLDLLTRLKKLKLTLSIQHKIPDNKLFIDDVKFRLLTSTSIAEKIKSGRDHSTAIVLEYPTFDSLELEVEFI